MNIWYDRQGRLLPNGREDFVRLANDYDYVFLHKDFFGAYAVTTMWTGLDMSSTMSHIHFQMMGMANPLPLVFATQIQPIEPRCMADLLFGFYLEKFAREDQAGAQHARAVAWLRSNLELEA